MKKMAMAVIGLAFLASLTGCKGRTLDNVESNGETIEVTPIAADTDSIG